MLARPKVQVQAWCPCWICCPWLYGSEIMDHPWDKDPLYLVLLKVYWLHIEETALNCSAGSMSEIHISYQCLDLDTRAMTLSLLYDFHSRLSFIITHKPSVSKHNQSWILLTIVSVWIMVFFSHFWRELKCANKN